MADWTTIQLNLRYRWKTVLMWGIGIGGALVLVSSIVHAATLDIPGEGTTLSGIGVISGWKCEAGELAIRFNGDTPLPLVYGSERKDVLEEGVCAHANVGFVAIWNWGNLRAGEHTAVVYDDGEEFARSTFTVASTGEKFVRGASGQCRIANFPASGESTLFAWNESTQHLELVHVAQTQNQTRKMYWTTDGRIQRANLDGTQVETLFAGEQAPDSDYSELALDLAGGKMYWTNNCCIYRANLDGSLVEALVSEGNIDGLALDPVGNKMYWISARRLRWANLDGTQVETFLPVEANAHAGLFLDLAGGKLYWIGYRDGSRAMQRANLDGTQLETFFTNTPLPSLTESFALDLTKSKVYGIKFDIIYRANLDDGSHVEYLVRDVGDGTSLALDMAGGKMYYTAQPGKSPRLDGIYRANLDGSQVEALVTGLDDPGGLVLVLE